MNNHSKSKIVVLMPVYNDSASFSWIVRELDTALRPLRVSVSVIGVDDGSFEPLEFEASGWKAEAIEEVQCLTLRGNVGHQSAIAIGLAHVYENVKCDAVVVMDADGEDKPSDAARLIEHFQNSAGVSITFAERRRRSEGLIFRAFYFMYRILARVLTGHKVRVGNFSIVPAQQLQRLVISPSLWVHYAAAVFRARVPRDSIPTQRGRRAIGQSSMNFVALVMHGLGAISVFGATVGVRLTVTSVAASSVGIVLWATFFFIRIVKYDSRIDVLLLGWGLTILIVSQLLLASFAFVFFILDNRTKLSFLPLRDYSLFVSSIRTLYTKES